MTTLRAIALLLAIAATVSAAPAAVDVQVDMRTTYQVMDGFGSSGRVWIDPHLSDAPQTSVPPTAQQEILARIYGDLGLTRLRFVFDGGIEPINDNDDPNTFDWSKFNFAGKRNDAFVELVAQAAPYGLRTYFPSPVMLEPWMNEGNPAEYAEWVMAVLLRWRTLGRELPYYSLINEPAHRRSGRWSGRWLAEVIKVLGPRMRGAGLKTLLVIPDDLNADEAYRRASEALADPAVRPYIGALAYHMYGGSPKALQDMRALSARYGISLWMTEFSNRGYGEYPGALEWAKLMHSLLSDYGVSAVDYIWGFFGAHPAEQGNSLVAIDFRHGVYNGYTLTPSYYVTGHFSRFVRPGYTRVRVSSNDLEILISAYRGPDQIVIVAINPHGRPRQVNVGVTGGSSPPTVQHVRTDRTVQWGMERPISVRGAAFSVVLPAESVTTLVGATK